MLKRLCLAAGLSLLMVGCTTGYYSGQQIDSKLYSYDGDSDARMGVRYLFGRGVPQDNQKAFAYFKQAADKGDVFAQNEIAYLYAAGKGTHQSYKQSFHWYQKAAKAGLSSAQYNLGFMYLHGLGTKKDKDLAMTWFKKSADLNFGPAKTQLEKA